MQNVGNRIVVPPRPRIAPVNPALISTAKLRDPRLMRQPAVQQAQTLPTPPVNSIAAQTQPKANEPTSGTNRQFLNVIWHSLLKLFII